MHNLRFIGFILLVLLLLNACYNDIESYTLGRGIYYTFEANLKYTTIDKMEDRYNQTLAETANVQFVEPSQIMSLFNDLALIAALEVDNPYGLMGDLSELLRGAGAEYAEDGSMISVRPVSVGMLRAFSRGWKNSKLEKSTR